MNVLSKKKKGGALSEASLTWLLWTLGAGLFVQFHGVHTAAALFKVILLVIIY
jgi:hypothetical protein